MTTARFIGGPLDGREITRSGKGRWCIYRNDDGHPIEPIEGDREFWTFAGAPRCRHYIHQQDQNGAHVYVHATVIDRWQR